jgi:hypothetical protein
MLQLQSIVMATHEVVAPANVHRIVIHTALLVGLGVLLITQDPHGFAPYLALALALLVAVRGYVRCRPRRPWECNDEP